MNPYRNGSVVTMGTFDGVHRGHQAILRKTVRLARRLRVPAVAVTFARPPRLFFKPQAGPSLLTLLPEKIALLNRFGVYRVEALTFDRRLARLDAGSFFERFFLRRFRAKAIVVGYNFAFGRGREGDTSFLKRRGAAEGIAVRVVQPVRSGPEPVSSGRVRDRLRAGDLSKANVKLGYPYFIHGRVKRGAGLGRKLGYPTANLEIDREKLVPPGVFAVRVALPVGARRGGMCNVGVRPTVGGRRLVTEVHLFGFRGVLTGRVLRVEFIKKLRSERKFASLARLAAQLRRDAAAARRALRRTS
jgi:riboflavin kinase/FMN adenylyltransferase